MKIFKRFLLLSLLIVTVLIVSIYVSWDAEKEKTYYFPQIEMYLKVHKPPLSKYGYVVFSKDSTFTFSEDIDFVRIYKSEVSEVRFIFNPKEKNRFYLIDRSNNAQVNQVNFAIREINGKDTTFFEQEVIAKMGCISTLKPIYFEITIEGFLQSVFYNNGVEEYLTKAKPINKK